MFRTSKTTWFRRTLGLSMAVALGLGGLQLASAQTGSESLPAVKKAVKELAEAGEFSKRSDAEILSLLEAKGLFGGEKGAAVRIEAETLIGKYRIRKAGQIEREASLPSVPTTQVSGVADDAAPGKAAPPDALTAWDNEAGAGPFRLTTPPANGLYMDQMTLANIGIFPPATIDRIELPIRNVTTTQAIVVEVTFWDTLDPFATVGTSVVTSQLGPTYAFSFGTLAPGTYYTVPLTLSPAVTLTDNDICVQVAYRNSVGGPYATGCTMHFFTAGTATPTPQVGASIDGWWMDATTPNNILESNELFDFATPNNSADFRMHLYGTKPTSESEPNDSAATADLTDCGHTLSGSIGAAGDVDFYKFTIIEDNTVTVALSGCTGDATLTLRNSSLSVVDSASGGCPSVVQLLAPDTYYIEVHELGDDATLSYSVTPTCVPTPDDEVEPNNTAATANPIASGNNKKARISPIGDLDYWVLTVAPAVGGAHLSASVDCRGGDSTLELRDSTDTQIAFDDDGGTGSCSALSLCLAPGTYYLVVRDFGNNNTMPYFLAVTLDTCTVDETEPNGSPATAGAIACGETKSGGVDFSGDSDYWTFTTTSTQNVYIDVNCGSGDSLVELSNGGGPIGSDDDGGPGLCSHFEDQIPADTYYVKVSGFLSSVFGYTLSIVCADVPAVDETEPNDTAATANPIACGETKGGVLTSGDIDYYSFSVTGVTSVSASVSVPLSGVQKLVSILDATEASITSGSSSASAILTTGSYYVTVDEISGGSAAASYSLSLDCTTTIIPSGCVDNGHTVTSSISSPGDLIQYGYSATAGETVRIIVKSLDMDVNVLVVDGGGNLVDRDDDDADGTDAQVCFVPSSTGSLTVMVAAGGGGTGTFTISTDILRTVSRSEDEPNNDSIPGEDILNNQRISGVVDSLGDKDFFRFFGGVGDVVSTYALSCGGNDNTPNPATDLTLEIQNGSGTPIFTSDDEGEDLDPQILDVVLPASPGFAYYIVVGATTPGGYDLFFQWNYIPFTFGPNPGSTPIKVSPGAVIRGDATAGNPSSERRLAWKIERIIGGVPVQLAGRTNVRAPAGFTKTKTNFRVDTVPAVAAGTNITYKLTVTVNGRPRALDFDVQVQ